MIVNTKGFGRKKSAEIRAAAKFYADILMDPRVVRNLVLDIQRDDTLDAMGYCANDDDRTRSPRWFTIELRGTKKDDDPVKTLAHEMVHVKQYAKNELGADRSLVLSRGGKAKEATKWLGKWWTASKKQDPYYDAPWEVEAYGMEVGLFHKWSLAQAKAKKIKTKVK